MTILKIIYLLLILNFLKIKKSNTLCSLVSLKKIKKKIFYIYIYIYIDIGIDVIFCYYLTIIEVLKHGDLLFK